MKKLVTVAALAGLALAVPAQDADREAIEAKVRGYVDAQAIEGAVRDYLEAFYQQKPELLERSVHAELAKYGYMRGAGGGYTGSAMTRDELKEIAANFHQYGAHGPDAPREIVVLDRLDKTAAAKLTASWGIDYLHLAKLDGRWQIVQVLWQTAPAPPDDAATAAAAAEADRRAIERAVLDYVESAYEVKPENVDRSVSRDLVKLGFTRRAGDEEWRRHDMDFDGLRALVATWNADGRMPADAVKEVAVLDQLDRVAAAKATAQWGIDYFQLARDAEGRWKIRQVLWQSHPLDPDGAAR